MLGSCPYRQLTLRDVPVIVLSKPCCPPGLPGHVVVRLRQGEAGPSDSTFIDVFDQGRIMNW